MRILIDLDDVLHHLSDAWSEYLNKKYNRHVKMEEITSWEWEPFYPGLTREEIFEPLGNEDFWKTVKPFEGAAEVLQKLIDSGNEIYVVTASSYKGLRGKLDNTLFRYFPMIDYRHVIVAYNKQLIDGDILIDDNSENLEGGNYVKILMTAPYNKAYDAEANGMIRVNDWDEVYEAISMIAEYHIIAERTREFHGVGVNSCEKKIRNDIFGEESNGR